MGSFSHWREKMNALLFPSGTRLSTPEDEPEIYAMRRKWGLASAENLKQLQEQEALESRKQALEKRRETLEKIRASKSEENKRIEREYSLMKKAENEPVIVKRSSPKKRSPTKPKRHAY